MSDFFRIVHLQQVWLDRQEHVLSVEESTSCGNKQPYHASSSQKTFTFHNLDITVLSLDHISTMAFTQLSIGEYITLDQPPLGKMVKEKMVSLVILLISCLEC